MLYPYNAIFGRGLLNTFEVALHSGYLYFEIPATFGVISVFDSQQDAMVSRQATKMYTFCGKSQSSTTPSLAPIKQKLQ
jgi:hypothetical protein